MKQPEFGEIGGVGCDYDMLPRCEGEPTWHIIWNHEVDNALSCDEHVKIALSDYEPIQVHRRAPDCGMPGARWFPLEATCRVPPRDDPFHAMLDADEELPVNQPELVGV